MNKPKYHPRTSIAIAASGSDFYFTVAIQAVVWLVGVTLECYDSTNNVTRTIQLKDDNSVVIFESGAQADAASVYVPVSKAGPNSIDLLGVPMMNGWTLNLHLSGDAGGTGGTDYATLWFFDPF